MTASDASLDRLIEDYQTAIGAVCEIAEAYYRLGKLDAALTALQAGALLLEDAAEEQRLDDSRAKLLLQQGKLLVTKGFYANSGYEAAASTLLRAQGLATSIGDEGGSADALQLLGQAAYNKTVHGSEGDYTQALDYFQQALARREKLEDRRGIAESLFYIGLIHERWQQPGEAESYYTRALAIAQESGYQIEQSYALRHLAGLAQEAGDLEKTLTLFTESLTLREGAGYKILLPLSHIAVGDVLLAQQHLPQATTHYQVAYAIAQELDTPVAQMICMLSLGALYQQQQELAQARSYFEQAYDQAKEIDMQWAMGVASRELEGIARLEHNS
ncbi:MAG TPA: tetratricopeptide repeat protein [Ktedonobacterales bacterium]